MAHAPVDHAHLHGDSEDEGDTFGPDSVLDSLGSALSFSDDDLDADAPLSPATLGDGLHGSVHSLLNDQAVDIHPALPSGADDDAESGRPRSPQAQFDVDPDGLISMDEALRVVTSTSQRFQHLLTHTLGYISFVDGLTVLSMVFMSRIDPATGQGEAGMVIEEYGLVGEQQYLIGVVNSLFFLGWMIGAGLFGSISDRYGRKKAMICAISTFLLGGILTSVAWALWVYMLARVVTGVGVGGQGLINWVWAAEYWPPDWRERAGPMFQAYYAAGFVLLSFIAPFVSSWRILALATTLPILLFVLVAAWVPESARWVLVHRGSAAAKDTMKAMAGLNRTPVPAPALAVPRVAPGSILSSIPRLFSRSVIRRRTLVSMYLWFSSAFVYYGLSLNTGNLAGNFSVNVLLVATVELPAYMSAVWLVKRGRRLAVGIYFGLAGLCCLMALGKPEPMVGLVLVLIGKFGISGAFTTTYLFTTELFPTTVRNTGTGLSSQAARIGGMTAPLVVVLIRDDTLVIFGAVAAVAAVLALLLPETRGTTLPETVESLADTQDVNAFQACLQRWRRSRPARVPGNTRLSDGDTIALSAIPAGMAGIGGDDGEGRQGSSHPAIGGADHALDGGLRPQPLPKAHLSNGGPGIEDEDEDEDEDYGQFTLGFEEDASDGGMFDIRYDGDEDGL